MTCVARERILRLVAALSLALLGLGLGLAPQADAQGQVSLSWTKRYAGAGSSTPITCPTVSFCMLGAAGRSGVAFAGDPFTGPFRKSGPVPGSARACASRRLCLSRRSARPDFINDVIVASRRPQ